MPPYHRWVSRRQMRMANAGGMKGLSRRDLKGKNEASKGRWLPESARKKRGK